MTTKAMRRWGWTVALGATVSVCSTGAWAQQQVARLKQVSGNVLVSGQSGLATGSEGQPLASGVRVITTANSRVIVAFDNGCDVRLEENQRFDVESGKPCAALLPQALGAAAASNEAFALIIPALIGAAGARQVVTTSGGVINPLIPVSPN